MQSLFKKSKVYIFFIFIFFTLISSYFFKPYLTRYSAVPFVAFCILTSFVTLPLGAVTKFLGGWIFGFIPGFLITHFGLLFGSYLGFKFSRYSLREFIFDRYSEQLERFHLTCDKINIFHVVQLRLFPYFPLQVLNYLFGISKVKDRDFFLGSFIGMMPASLIYAWFGSKYSNITLETINISDLLPAQLTLLGMCFMTFYFREKSVIQKQLIPHLNNLRQNSNDHSWDEQAVPSYTHSNFFVRYVFWKRISHAYASTKRGGVVLDFGCGAGALLPLISEKHNQVYAYDQDEKSLTASKKLISIHNLNNVEILLNLSNIETQSLDAIYALDVLEHVENLPELLIEFKRVLKKDGKLVVSSPTENWVYKLARKFGGPGYQGEYHLRAAKEVEKDLMEIFNVKLKKRIFPVFTFFRIVVATSQN